METILDNGILYLQIDCNCGDIILVKIPFDFKGKILQCQRCKTIFKITEKEKNCPKDCHTTVKRRD